MLVALRHLRSPPRAYCGLHGQISSEEAVALSWQQGGTLLEIFSSSAVQFKGNDVFRLLQTHAVNAGIPLMTIVGGICAGIAFVMIRFALVQTFELFVDIAHNDCR